MILKEFWLDLSLDHFDIGENERIGPKHPAKKSSFDFFMETKCVTSYVERLNTTKIKCDFTRLIVMCCKTNHANNFSVVDGICTVYTRFDYGAYKKASNEEKKKIALNTLMYGIEVIARNYDWDMNVFYNISNKIIKNNYINNWVWKKKICRNDGAYYVSVIASLEMDAFRLFTKLYDSNDSLLCEKAVYSDLPDARIYYDIFGFVEWETNTSFAIYNKDKQSKIVIDFSEEII